MKVLPILKFISIKGDSWLRMETDILYYHSVYKSGHLCNPYKQGNLTVDIQQSGINSQKSKLISKTSEST